MSTITFKPKQITKKFLSVLPERSRDILIRRYGLNDEAKRATLEAIGKDYGITRERVRQIENNTLNNIRKSEVFDKEKRVFDELKDSVISLGSVLSEDDLLESLSSNTGRDADSKNHIHLLLVLGDHFSNEKENDEFKARWHVDKELSKSVHYALSKIHSSLTEEHLISEAEIVENFLNELGDVSKDYQNAEFAKRWLSLSKIIGSNSFGEWGLVSSPNISAKGIRDYAYLVIRHHGSPMHFTEVAKSITKLFEKQAHIATCHNELIKDERFVLVGRGLYALSEWGYASGIVRDVVAAILRKEGPLTKEEIIDRVLKERYVKENTIMVNLQNQKYFKKDQGGRYIVLI